MRLFAGVFPSSEELRRILAVQDDLRLQLPARLGWTRPERLHLTLRFFGDDAEENASAAAVSEAVEGIGAFDLVFDAVTGFPSARRARVVVLEACDPSDGILRIGSRLNREESKPYRPHITLARARTGQVAIEAPHFEPILLRVSEVCLVHSVLGGPDAGYHVLRRWRLEG